MSKPSYQLDIIVYERANMYELPVVVPSHMTSDSYLKPGPYSIEVFWNESMFNQFMAWAGKTSILKVIGTTKL